MIRSTVLKFGLSLLLVSSLLVACQSHRQPPIQFAFIGVNVVDLQQNRILPNQTVLIGDQKIVDSGPFSDLTVEQRARTIFAANQFLMPATLTLRAGQLRAVPSQTTAIEPQHRAALVLLSENPLGNDAALAKIEGAFQDGVWLDRAALALVTDV